MFKENLQNAITLLNELIEITQNDIENIQNAKHDLVDKSVKTKTALIKKFENAKNQIDEDLFNMLNEKKGMDLASVLDESDKEKLAVFKELRYLTRKMRKVRYVAIIKEYFASLSKEIFWKIHK